MTPGRLQDRVALITGAARGIGLAAARKLAGEGARVLISDIDAAELESAAQGVTAEGLQIVPVIADHLGWRALFPVLVGMALLAALTLVPTFRSGTRRG